MSTFVIFAILAVTAVSAEIFCTPGSFFKNDCNYCTCSSDGKTAACTDMACPKSLNAIQAGKFCQPGKTFQLDDCNACTCSSDGSSARCTLQFCTSQKNAITSKTSTFCTPGSVFSPDNCNQCICSKDGTKASCTLKMCENTKKISKPKQVCKPFSHFKDYCNTCTCSNDGLLFGCTDMWCDKNIWNKDGSRKDVPEIDEGKLGQKQVCQPFTTFKDYCNTCTCADDGLSFGCTYMWCDKNIWNKDGSRKDVPEIREKKLTQKQVCEPFATFKDYCNTCTCSNDGLLFGCTDMLCDKNIWNKDGSRKDVPEIDEGKLAQKLVCHPRSTFNDYCNTCACSDDGLSYACTRMTCDKDIWNEDGSLKLMKVAAKSVERVCAPNTQFMEQCNTCICSNDGHSKMCTMMTCNAVNSKNSRELEIVQKQVCQPHSTFNDYCNTCACSEDGLSYACTRMTCDKDIWNKDGSLKFMKVAAKSVCTPGTVFSPDGCNTCICSNDGTQTACTLKLCLSTFKQAFKQFDEDKKWGPIYNQGEFCTPGKLFFSECNQCVCTKTGRSAICTLMECGAKA